MGKWLTKEERQSLSREDQKALRKERQLVRWPDTDGMPPWKVKLAAVLDDVGDGVVLFAQRAAIVLVKAALGAVKEAALSTLAGGEAKHEFAVDRLLEAAGDHALRLGRDEAASMIVDAFDVLDSAGEI